MTNHAVKKLYAEVHKHGDHDQSDHAKRGSAAGVAAGAAGGRAVLRNVDSEVSRDFASFHDGAANRAKRQGFRDRNNNARSKRSAEHNLARTKELRDNPNLPNNKMADSFRETYAVEAARDEQTLERVKRQGSVDNVRNTRNQTSHQRSARRLEAEAGKAKRSRNVYGAVAGLLAAGAAKEGAEYMSHNKKVRKLYEEVHKHGDHDQSDHAKRGAAASTVAGGLAGGSLGSARTSRTSRQRGEASGARAEIYGDQVKASRRLREQRLNRLGSYDDVIRQGVPELKPELAKVPGAREFFEADVNNAKAQRKKTVSNILDSDIQRNQRLIPEHAKHVAARDKSLAAAKKYKKNAKRGGVAAGVAAAVALNEARNKKIHKLYEQTHGAEA